MTRFLFVEWDTYGSLAVMQLASVLEEQGHDVFFLCAKLEKNVAKKAEKLCPDVVAYSCTTPDFRAYLGLNRLLKQEFDFKSFFGGVHASFCPEIIEEPGVDVVCRGEGEGAVTDYADALDKGKSVSGIKNLWVREKNRVFKNPLRPLIKDLDSLPFADHELVRKYRRYRSILPKFITGRGCPFGCTYCFNPPMRRMYAGRGEWVRKRSVGNVLEELAEKVSRYGYEKLWFVDDVFVVDRGWTKRFCERYAKDFGLPFICNVRADLLDEEVVSWLSKAGCETVTFAIESGNDFLRNNVLGRDMSREQILSAAKLVRDHGLKLNIQNMLCLPGESIENGFETLELNIECRPAYAWASVLQPYPCTRIYREALEKGFLEEKNGGAETYFDESRLVLKDKEKLENLQKLFAWGVEYPFLVPLIKKLVGFPPNFLFNLAYGFSKRLSVGTREL